MHKQSFFFHPVLWLLIHNNSALHNIYCACFPWNNEWIFQVASKIYDATKCTQQTQTNEQMKEKVKETGKSDGNGTERNKYYCPCSLFSVQVSRSN